MKARPNYMPPEQFNQVIEAIPSLKIRKWNDEDVVMLFKICYWCCLRISEAISLSRDDFDFQRNEVYLGKTKTEKQATAAIPPNFIPELQMWLSSKTGVLLYDGLEYQNVYFWIKRLGIMLNIPAWTTPQSETGEKTKTHIFRKSISKDLLYGTYDGRKAPINVISKQLRHKGKNPIGTTYHYLKLDVEDVKDWWQSGQAENSNVISKKASSTSQPDDTWQKPFD